MRVVRGLIICLVLLMTACSQSASLAEPAPETTQDQSDREQQTSPLFPELPSALEVPEEKLAPLTLTIGSLNIIEAPIDGVGVEPNGEMEVPSAQRVGWYSFGAEPGAEGSSVLAGHIAADGVDGVFRNLDQVEIGAEIEVTYDAAEETQKFRVFSLEQYDKSELPFDDIFRRDGQPQLVLITCGGDFNTTEDSYEDNVVAYAEPL